MTAQGRFATFIKKKTLIFRTTGIEKLNFNVCLCEGDILLTAPQRKIPQD
jgi:hypothetical protein